MADDLNKPRLDRYGREIGFDVFAKCDNDGCDKDIHRGLAHACGGSRGENHIYCGRYVCGAHLQTWIEIEPDEWIRICDHCRDRLFLTGEWNYNKEYKELTHVTCEQY